VVDGWRVYACNPVLWLTIPGFAIMLWRRNLRPEGLLITGMAVAYLLFIGNYGSTMYEWGGGLYLGPRHLIPLLPFLAPPLYFGAAKLRFVFYPLALLSIFYMLLATAVEPRVAFPFGDIARDFLIPDYLRGQLAQNTASLFDSEHRNLTNDSTAANLAKMIGLPGRYQLIPLMLWWMIAGAVFLFWRTERRDKPWKNTAIALGLVVAAIAFAPPIHHAVTFPSVGEHGLLAKYYRNAKWEGAPAEIQIDPAIDFDWSKEMPYPPPFSVEWTGNILIERTGHYLLSLVADDGALLHVDNNLVVDATGASLQEKGQTVFLAEGPHLIRVRYFNLSANGMIKFFWTLVGRPRQPVPSEVLTPVVARRNPARP
ncbi:MAG TPA: PA14 domain-containing protein, partial [Chthoniobacterales bacterium]|nr:PA14 domain-containing protein [Chthoniobacterales bacterium]